MSHSLFLAGASGAIGRRLAPLLVVDGWRIVATTRSENKTAALRQMGVEPVVVDVFDADALREAVARARPSVVIHQLTDLPAGLDPNLMAAALPRNAQIRDEGTRNLIAAAVRVGVGRLIVQSIAFAYADGPRPHSEEDRLNIDAEGGARVSIRGIASLSGRRLTPHCTPSCFAMVGSTARAQALTQHRVPVRSMWTPPRKLRDWP